MDVNTMFIIFGYSPLIYFIRPSLKIGQQFVEHGREEISHTSFYKCDHCIGFVH